MPYTVYKQLGASLSHQAGVISKTSMQQVRNESRQYIVRFRNCMTSCFIMLVLSDSKAPLPQAMVLQNESVAAFVEFVR
jgi:hypothetical protein